MSRPPAPRPKGSHGAPLVLKSDNGSAFVASAFEALLAGLRVWQLLSPPRLPSYNGSCEAGIGSMKARTHHQATRLGRAGEWTCDDAEAARQQANQTALQASTRLNTVETVVGNIDQYQPATQTEIRFRSGNTVLGAKSKAALDDMTSNLKDQQGYIVALTLALVSIVLLIAIEAFKRRQERLQRT